MSVCSYIWDSQAHLSTTAFWFEITAAIVEAVVSVVIVSTFHKEWDEKIKQKMEFLVEVGFLIAALIAIVAIVSNRRLETLREHEEQTAEDNIKSAVSDALSAAAQATNAAGAAKTSAGNAAEQAEKLAAANAKVGELEANAKWRRISMEQKTFIFNRLNQFSPRCRIHIHVYTFDTETDTFSGDWLACLSCWGAEGGIEIVGGAGGNVNRYGILIETRNPPSAGAMEVVKTLIEAKVIPATTIIVTNQTEDVLAITIGPKPPP